MPCLRPETAPLFEIVAEPPMTKIPASPNPEIDAPAALVTVPPPKSSTPWSAVETIVPEFRTLPTPPVTRMASKPLVKFPVLLTLPLAESSMA